MLGQLFQNFCIMVALVYGASLTVSHWPLKSSRSRVRAAVVIALMSLLPLLLVIFAAEVRPGVRFDLRHVPIALVTLWAGPGLGLLTALPMIIYRLMHFGPGTWPSCLAAVCVVGMGTLLRSRLDLIGNYSALGWGQLPWVTLLFSLNGLSALMVPDGFNIVKMTFLPLLILNICGFYLASTIVRGRIQLLSSLSTARNEAQIDSLSGVFNRRQFDKDLSTLQTSDILLLVDIDHFKSVNDVFGHAVGDKVLKEVGRILRLSLRTSDAAYRYGGEEFAIIVRGSSPVHALMIAERLRHKLSQVHVPEIRGRTLTVSVGVACAGEHLPAVTLQQADESLYLAKRNGRNRVELWNLETSYF